MGPEDQGENNSYHYVISNCIVSNSDSFDSRPGKYPTRRKRKKDSLPVPVDELGLGVEAPGTSNTPVPGPGP